MTDAPATLAEALAALQTQLPVIPKKAKAQYGNYADLADVSSKLLPIMGKLGLSFSAKQTWVTREDGTREVVLAYSLRHVSGEHDDGEYPLGAGLPSHQALGSASTYGRRYVLCAMTGAVAEDDDDGQVAEDEAKNAPRGRKPPVRAAGNLPRNRDGSVSRSQTTDEELADTGQMTDGQVRDHGRLEREVKGTGPQGTERLGETPPDDLFYDPPPVAVRTPKPAGKPVAVIQQYFHNLGYSDSPEDRQARLKRLSAIAGRPISSTNDLSAGEGIKVIRLLEKCDDIAALDEALAVMAGEATEA